MSFKWTWLAVPVCAALLSAADGDQPWKTKRPAEWSDEDAKLIMSDSPWAKEVVPQLAAGQQGQAPGAGRARGMGRGGIGIGGVGVGFPGGGRRYPGGGYPGGGYPGSGGRYPGNGGGGNGKARNPNNQKPPTLMVRWESAQPVREAELKAREDAAPTIDESHYAIAVYNVPSRFASQDSKSFANELKKQASIKRDGKKDLKPSSVEILRRDSSVVVVYLFPRSNEITKGDRRVLFDAQIGRLQFAQSFYTEDMVMDGKLEL
jgi:hypothetical protein